MLPVGTTIDPGGIGKGLAADIVTGELVAARALGAMVEIGGDLCVAGIGPYAMSGWVIEVDPGVTTGITSVALSAGGVAMSTSRLRTWTVDGRTRHHLVDPQTLDCSDSDSVSCTVIAGTAAWAEAFTKTAFALSPADGDRRVRSPRSGGGDRHDRRRPDHESHVGALRAMNEQVWWYLSRSSGIVALVLLVASMVWGVLLATRALKPHDRPAWLLDLHRWLGGMALVMTGLHVLGLVLDGYVSFGFAEVLVPGTSEYRPFAVALGVVSMYLMIAVQASSYLKRRLSARVWRTVHTSSYGLVWVATIHAGMAGTDTVNRAYQVLALVLTMMVVAVTVVRIVAPTRETGRPHVPVDRTHQASPRHRTRHRTRHHVVERA